MKFAAISALLALFYISVVSGSADVEYEKHVAVLTVDNFAKFISDNEFVLAEYYAPWCGHCKSLQPHYERAAESLSVSHPQIKLAKIDATVQQMLAADAGIQGYPTLKFYVKGVPHNYQGGRTTEEIKSWLIKQVSDPTTRITSVEELEELQKAHNVVVVGHFDDLKHSSVEEFSKAARHHDDIVFVTTDSDAVRAHLDVKPNSVVVLKNFDELRADFDDELTADNVKAFVRKHSLPLVIEFLPETQKQIFGGEAKEHALLFVNSAETELKEELLKCYKDLSKKTGDKMMMVMVDTSNEQVANVRDFFKIPALTPSAFRIVNLSKDVQKYSLDEEISCGSIESFVDNYLAGNVAEYFMSEEIPEDWNSEPVKVLVGKNFKDVAFDETKGVFVEFYAPWCGHCKSLEPIWKKVGEHFADSADVVIAKMDSTANEVDVVRIAGFPSLKFFSKGSNKVVDYDGGRTFEDLVAFVDKMMGTDSLAGKKSDGDDEEKSDDASESDDSSESAKDKGDL